MTFVHLAGSDGGLGWFDGPGSSARFCRPFGLAVDASGNVYVADSWNHSIRKGSPGLADAATIDNPKGAVGSYRLLGSSPKTATACKWEVVRRPAGSTAPLAPETTPSTSFTPDVEGLYTFRLAATDGARWSFTTVDLTAAVDPTQLLLGGGKVGVRVAWKSQYTGRTGTATAISKGSDYGYLYFSDAANPEVFVKVLDFGSDRPFLLFAAGLTDFQYTVTYRNVRTGKDVVFTKPSGGYGGLADGTSLGH